MRAYVVALLAAACLMACGAAAAEVAARPSTGCSAATIQTGRRLERTLDVDGVTRKYILDVPEQIQPGKPVPVLFDFHGFGHSASGVWNVSRFRDLAPQERFITVYPDGLPVTLMEQTDRGWEIFTTDGNRDVAFTRRLLDDLERTYCIDRARLFATGFSNGAFFSALLACTMSDRFAAVAPVSGGPLPVSCAPSRAVPVLIHHGRRDERIDVAKARRARDAWVEKNGCHEHTSNGCDWYRGCRDGAEVEYCEDDGEHYWPVEATGRIWEFFRAHPMKEQRMEPPIHADEHRSEE